MLPRTTAAFSSAVPVARLFDANLGRSVLSSSQRKWPSLVKISWPVGFAPRVGVRRPSGLTLSEDSKIHTPASSLADCADAEPANSAHRHISPAAMLLECVDRCINLILVSIR